MPDWQCPACGVAYAKYESAPEAQPVAQTRHVEIGERSGSWKIVKIGFAVATLLAILAVTPAPNWFHSALTGGASAGDLTRGLKDKDFSRASIVMYSLTTCDYCASLRRTFEANRIPFKECFIDTDAARERELTRKLRAAGFKSGWFGTPTLEVNGKMMPNNPPFEQIIKQALS